MPDSIFQGLFARAEKYRAEGLFGKARPLHEKVFGGSRDSSLRFESSLSLVSIFRSLGNIKEARAWLQRARGEMKRGGFLDWAEAVELEEILIDRADGQYRASLKRLSAVFKRRLLEKDFQACGFIQWAMGGALRFSGNLAAAEEAYLRSLDFAVRARDREGAIYALLGMGGVCRIQGKLGDSERHYFAAQKALRGSSDLFARAYAHCGLGNALRQKGSFSQAEICYRKSRGIYQKLGDDADLGYVEWGLARLKMQMGKIEAAQEFLKRALALFRRSGEKRGLVLARLSLAQILHARGQREKAQTLFEQALRLSKSAGLSAHLELFT